MLCDDIIVRDRTLMLNYGKVRYQCIAMYNMNNGHFCVTYALV